MMRNRISGIVVVLVMSLPCLAHDAAGGAVVIDLRSDAARDRTVQALSSRYQSRREQALALAREHGWNIRGTTPDGRGFELVDLRNGRPYYYFTMNANAAVSTAADRVRATAPFHVDGSGVIAGLWDGGAVRLTHQEFGSRVSVEDDATLNLNSWHSTHVAGTIGAAGVVASAKGMAPAVTIHSFDWIDDLSEVAGRAATGPDQPGAIYVSNHSYGYALGWANGNWSGIYGPHWFGYDLADREDRSFGQYNAFSEEWDHLAHSAPYYMPVWAAGNDRNDPAPSPDSTFYYYVNWPPGKRGWHSNSYDPGTDPYADGWKDGGYNTIGYHGAGKNTLTVGAVHDAVSGGERNLGAAAMSEFSAWGPTDDGRIKPDVVGNGVSLYSPSSGNDTHYQNASGTSMAAPNVTGSALLLVDYYRSLFENQNMRAATLKGVIIHTADDLGNPGPDYRFGWGLMNTELAAGQIKRHAAHPEAGYLLESALTPTVPAQVYNFVWNGRDPIRATLSWTDPPGTAQETLNVTTPTLVNDLDLRLVGPDGVTVYRPYILDPANPALPAITGDNIRDNVEQVFLPTPDPMGEYTVTVTHKGELTDGMQAYSLLLSGQAPLGGATLALHDLNQTYDGTERAVTVETDPPGIQTAVTYDGQAQPPTDAGDYAVVATVTDYRHVETAVTGLLSVARADAQVEWPAPDPIAYGILLGPGQLNASAWASGIFVYDPPEGTLLLPGTNHLLTAQFIPDDPPNILSATNTVAIDVHPTILATASAGGTVTPGGTVVVPYGGATAIVVRADTYWMIEDLVVDGSPITQAAGLFAYTNEWSSVVAPHTLAAFFEAMTATNAVPYGWLAGHGLTNAWTLPDGLSAEAWDAVAMEDSDGDGFKNWQEYVADTDPTDSNDYFRVIGLDSGPPVTVHFEPGSTGRIYTLLVSTNADSGPWTVPPGFDPRPGEGGADAMEDPESVPGPRFYRLEVKLP